MTDPRTQAYLRELANKAQQEPCDCRYCTEERKKGSMGMPVFPLSSLNTKNASSDPMTEALKTLVQEGRDKLKRLDGRCDDPQPTLYDKTIPEPPSNFHPELSSNPDMWDYSKRHKRV